MDKNNIDENDDEIVTSEDQSKGFSRGVYLVFFWCMIGSLVIYGIRLYFDVPTHPTFLPIVGAAFAGILSFTLVISFEYYVGPIEIKFGKDRGFSGAGGPIILWCICFLVIVFGLYLLGMPDAISKKLEASDYRPCAVHTLISRGECSNKLTK